MKQWLCVLQKKYNFSDISVLYRMKNGTYMNLSDFEFGIVPESVVLEEQQSRYLLALFTHCTANRNCLCPVTLPELLQLANVRNERFVIQTKTGTEDEGDNILALVCAKKILNYGRGKCILKEDNDGMLCEFMRYDGYGKRRTVLVKKFHMREQRL